MPTSKDVSKLAGVSVATVCRVFNEDNRVSAVNREKVLTAAHELGYTPNFIARSLKANRSDTVGLIMADSDNPFYFTVIAQLERELKSCGYKIVLLFSDESPETERKNFEILLSSQVDGVIFTPIDVKNSSTVMKIRERGLPILQIFRNPYPEIDSLTVDDEMGTFYATDYLIRKGHRRILLITESPKLPSHRENGFQNAFIKNRLQYNGSAVVSIPFYSDFDQQLAQALQSYCPTAILSIANRVGQGVYRYLQKNGLNIPGDISLIQYDDLPWTSLLNITAVAHPMDKIGKLAGEMILRRIRKEESSECVSQKIETALMVRGSVREIKEEEK